MKANPRVQRRSDPKEPSLERVRSVLETTAIDREVPGVNTKGEETALEPRESFAAEGKLAFIHRRKACVETLPIALRDRLRH